MTTIVRLQAEAVKRIRAVDITPDGPVVTIRGNNAQGKSSVLDAIAYALGGKGIAPPKVIRRGEPAARVVLELDDLVVERRWTTNDKSTLEVRSKDGAKYPSPQAMLDRLVGELSFDPLAFLRLAPKVQAETLAKLVGLDVAAMDAERAAIFDERTVVNRDGAALAARVKALPPPDPEARSVDPAALVAELDRLNAIAEVRASLLRDSVAAQATARRAQETVDSANRAVEDARRRLAQAEEVAARAVESAKRAEVGSAEAFAAAQGAADPSADLERVRGELAAVETTNAKARAAAQHRTLSAELEAMRVKSKALSDRLAVHDADREAKMAAAPMPVPGLAIADGALTLSGLPIEQASSAEQLTVSVAMGLALNPKLRVLLVRDGSLLDQTSMAALTKLAAEAGAQVWIEVVGDEGVGIVIEDGAVKGAAKPKNAKRVNGENAEARNDG